MVESGTDAAEIERLLRRGHTLRFLPTGGVSQAIMRGPAEELIGCGTIPESPGKRPRGVPQTNYSRPVGPPGPGTATLYQ